MNRETNRIVIAYRNVVGNLKRCKTCNINFTAFDNCITCQLIIEKEQELGRKLTNNECLKITKYIFED